MYKATLFNFEDEMHYFEVKDRLEDIEDRDTSFHLESDDNNLKLFVKHPDKNILHRKCTWIIHNADESGQVVYKVNKVGDEN